MSDRQLSQAHHDLKTVTAIQELFSVRDHWTAGTIAQDVDGHSVDYTSSRAYKFCFVGAYCHVIGQSLDERIDEGNVARIFGCESGGLININDHKGYEAVMQWLDRTADRLNAMIATPK